MFSLFYINNVEFYFKCTKPNRVLVSNAGLGILRRKLQEIVQKMLGSIHLVDVLRAKAERFMEASNSFGLILS